ncbi:hypothetical protein IQ06DRAFT_108683 [Phaeosphaeriaceae sp. SRC1lsM3a]|nr:hypothetical protein IQ06DRAFT_108683 [Stagonospora sp. SRC1lsM3a]
MCLARCDRPPSHRPGLTSVELSNSRIAFLAYTRAAQQTASPIAATSQRLRVGPKYGAAGLPAAPNLRLTSPSTACLGTSSDASPSRM